MSPVRVLFAIGVSLCLVGGSAFAQEKKPAKPPMPLTIDIPGTKDKVVSLQTAAAWPLTIRMLANESEGIATVKTPDWFPTGVQRAFVVFSDPDGCFSQTLDQLDPTASTVPCPNGPDETFLEFAPDINLPGAAKGDRYEDDPPSPICSVTDPSSCITLPPGLDPQRLPLGEPQTVPEFGGSNPSEPNAYRAVTGPATGGPAVKDNYGYGSSPNARGLVILSDTGVGNVWEDDVDGTTGKLKGVNLVWPRRARNLAGFVNVVSWTLNDCLGWKTLPDSCANGRSSVTAHMEVPFALFRPVTLADFDDIDADGNGTPEYERVVWRLDGGPLTYQTATATLEDALYAHVTTLRIFAVHLADGREPLDELSDEDGNGIVDINDAKLTPGVTVLSDESLVRLRTYNQDYAQAYVFRFDFFGDGMNPVIAPAGSGGVRDIPR